MRAKCEQGCVAPPGRTCDHTAEVIPLADDEIDLSDREVAELVVQTIREELAAGRHAGGRAARPGPILKGRPRGEAIDLDEDDLADLVVQILGEELERAATARTGRVSDRSRRRR